MQRKWTGDGQQIDRGQTGNGLNIVMRWIGYEQGVKKVDRKSTEGGHEVDMRWTEMNQK